jgi:hypothetical protein
MRDRATAIVTFNQGRHGSMSHTLDADGDPGQAPVYQVRLKGHLDRHWADWFGGLAITLEENGETLLTGPVVDQAALYGLLKRVRDVGLPLVSVTQINPAHVAAPDMSQHGATGSAEGDAAYTSSSGLVSTAERTAGNTRKDTT